MSWKDLMQYLVLVGILGGGLGVFYYVRPDTSLQFVVGVMTSIAYVFWGIIHHALKKDLHTRIMVEYVLMGAIAIVLLATILKT